MACRDNFNVTSDGEGETRSAAEFRGGVHIPGVVNRVEGDIVGRDKIVINELRIEPSPEAERLRQRLRATASLAPMPLTDHHIPRPDAVQELKGCFLGQNGIGGSGFARSRVAVFGMAGIGKSSIAAEFARDREVRGSYPDGVLWATFGRDPDVLSILTRIALALGDVEFDASDAIAAARRLVEIAKDKRTLLIFDDVWRPEHVPELFGFSGECRLLLTTRNRSVIEAVDAHEISAHTLSLREGIFFLAGLVGVESRELPDEAAMVARECGCIPLALSMISALIRKKILSWAEAAERLKQAKINTLRVVLPGYEYPSLLRSLSVSLDSLDKDGREAFNRCAVFPGDAEITEGAFFALWADLCEDQFAARLMAHDLIDRSLLLVSNENVQSNRRYKLHDLYYDYLFGVSEVSRRDYHKLLVDGYRMHLNGRCSNNLMDEYFVTWLPWHLQEANLREQLEHLLFDAPWTRNKISTKGTVSALKDLELSQNREEADCLQQGLRQSQHVLGLRPQLVGQQIAARLESGSGPNISRLISGLYQNQMRSELWPARVSIGGNLPLVFSLDRHRGAVTSFVVISKEEWLVSGSNDGSLCLWDLRTGILIAQYTGHAAPVRKVASVPGTQTCIVSASEDGTLRVWDLNLGLCTGILTGHVAEVDDVVVSGDGKYAISASRDKTFRVWSMATLEQLSVLSLSEVDSGYKWKISLMRCGSRALFAANNLLIICQLYPLESLIILNGHSDLVSEIVVTSDGSIAISASWDNTLVVWDLLACVAIHTLRGHRGNVSGVALLPGDRECVSASWDRRLIIWDIKSGRALRTLEGHKARIDALAISGDGRIVSAARDEAVKVWDHKTGDLLNDFSGHSAEINAVAFLSGGRRVLSASWDNTLKVWNASRRGSTLDPNRHDSKVMLQCEISP